MNTQERWLKLLSPERLGASTEHAVGHSPDRSRFQQDYDRIVFTSALRRLKDKTQVFPLAQSDYVRTRLTHSLEASCVGRSLGSMVGRAIVDRHGLAPEVHPSDFGAVVAAACLAHDIGNPPFGHAGEDAMRAWFASHSAYLAGLDPDQRADLLNYEGNAQGFRILTHLQNPTNPGGLQLTCAVLATFAKYPRRSYLAEPLAGKSARKFGYFQAEAGLFAEVADTVGLIPRAEGAWFRHPLTFLVEAADDTCYLVVDIEDGVQQGCVSPEQAEELLLDLAGGIEAASRLKHLEDPKRRIEYLRARAIGRLVDEAARIFLENEAAILDGSFDHALFDVSPVGETLHKVRKVAEEQIYNARQVMEVMAAGYEVISGLLDGYVDGACGPQTARNRVWANLLPADFDQTAGESNYLRLLQVADMIAGMTDSYAVSAYRRLKGIELPG
ncbi:MAG: deoxyguanosinetriphosphate triphosphohydrolase [Rhodocyclales bacterium]|nr:deoxyguanosinetriphosphate triphosphohydrolase [Rhodocyclales bacterium]